MSIILSGSGSAEVSGDVTTLDQLDLTNADPLTVAVVDANGDQIASFGGGTQYADGAARGSATGTIAMGDDGTNIQSVHVDTSGDLQVDVLTLPAIQLGDGITSPVQVVNGGNGKALQIHSGITDGLATPFVSDPIFVIGYYNPGFGRYDSFKASFLVDNLPATQSVNFGSFNYYFDGTNWDRVRGDSTDGLLVNLGANNDVTVTGTVTANLAAGTNNIGDVDVLTVPAPLSTTGGGTEATALRVTVANDSTGVLSVDDNGGNLSIDDGGNSITVDGTVTANAGTGTFTTKQLRAATPSQSSVNDSASNVTVLASNANRLGATVFNDSDQALYLKLGATASTTSFTVKMAAGSYYEVPFNYTGIIDGIWAADSTGAARVTEVTA